MTVTRAGESKGFSSAVVAELWSFAAQRLFPEKVAGGREHLKLGRSFSFSQMAPWKSVDAAPPPSLKTFLALAKASAITALSIAAFEIACHLLLVRLQHLLPDAIGRRPLNLIRDIFMEFIRRRIASGKVFFFLLISVSNFQWSFQISWSRGTLADPTLAWRLTDCLLP